MREIAGVSRELVRHTLKLRAAPEAMRVASATPFRDMTKSDGGTWINEVGKQGQ